MAEMNVNEREGEEYMPGWLMTCRSKAAWDRAFREREMKLSSFWQMFRGELEDTGQLWGQG